MPLTVMFRATALWTSGFMLAVLIGAGSVAAQDGARTGEYDPSKVDANSAVQTILFDIEYTPQIKQLLGGNAPAESRKVPLKVYLPATQAPTPVILFSHGLGGSREGFKHGGEHWARRGYIGVFIQHPGSDTSVWRDKKLGERMASAKEAANGQNLQLRIQDVKAVIDYLQSMDASENVTPEAKLLKGRMDLKHLGMSGHSFGAITTQMVSGQSPVIPSQHPTDERIKAALVLSPSVPKLGKPDKYFGQVSIPWMLMTGTKDDSPIGNETAETRLQVFEALSPGHKYQVVFEGGTHSFLGERASLRAADGASASHAKETVALSTAFWDTYLKGDDAAKAWLEGDGPTKLLSAEDKWQKK